MLSQLQDQVEMQSSVVAACLRCTRMQWYHGFYSPSCTRCLSNAWQIDGRSMRKVLVGVGKLGVDSKSSATLVTEVAASAGCRHMPHLCAWC